LTTGREIFPPANLLKPEEQRMSEERQQARLFGPAKAVYTRSGDSPRAHKRAQQRLLKEAGFTTTPPKVEAPRVMRAPMVEPTAHHHEERARERRGSRRATSTRGSPDDPDPGPSPPSVESQPQAEVATPSGNVEVLYRVAFALEAVQMADYATAEAVLRDLEDELKSAA
jgi:hypothetical protein